MRKLIGIICFFTLVSCQSDEIVQTQKFKTLMLKSVGEVETLPDMATFRISLECLDRSIHASKECLVEKSNELHGKLESFGIKKDDILTTSVRLNKSYTWRNNARVFEGYKSATTINVTVRSIEKLDEIYTDLLDNRNLDLGGLNYSHTKLDSLKNEAYINALEKSEILADRLLDKLPESQKEVLKIGNVEISASMPQYVESNAEVIVEREEMIDSQHRSISIGKGTVNVKATLFVEYQIR